MCDWNAGLITSVTTSLSDPSLMSRGLKVFAFTSRATVRNACGRLITTLAMVMSGATLREAKAAQVDTFIVGEGPHHTAIEAEELGSAVLYVGHYASETFGVRALGAEIERVFGIPWSFIAAPTGL